MSNIINTLKDFFGKIFDKDRPYRAVITFIFTTTFSVSTSVGIERYYKHVDAVTDRENHASSVFAEEANAFDTFVARYVHSLVDDQKVDPEARQLLVTNLIQQAQAVKDISKSTSKQQKDLLSRYTSALEAFNDTLSEANSVLKMRSFWEKASVIVTLRIEILKNLST